MPHSALVLRGRCHCHVADLHELGVDGQEAGGGDPVVVGQQDARPALLRTRPSRPGPGPHHGAAPGAHGPPSSHSSRSLLYFPVPFACPGCSAPSTAAPRPGPCAARPAGASSARARSTPSPATCARTRSRSRAGRRRGAASRSPGRRWRRRACGSGWSGRRCSRWPSWACCSRRRAGPLARPSALRRRLLGRGDGRLLAGLLRLLLRFRRRRISFMRSIMLGCLSSVTNGHSSPGHVICTHCGPPRRGLSSLYRRENRTVTSRADGPFRSGSLTMVLRLHSLKTRTALALSSVIVAILVFNGVYMILTKQQELRKGIEQDAVSFARLTRVPIASAFLSFYQFDFAKFREIVQDLLAMNRDVTKLLIVNERGQVLFDSAELAAGRPHPPAARAAPAAGAGAAGRGLPARRHPHPRPQPGGRRDPGDLRALQPGRLGAAPLRRLPGLLPPAQIGHAAPRLGHGRPDPRVHRHLPPRGRGPGHPHHQAAQGAHGGGPGDRPGPLRPPARHPLQRRAADPGRELQRHDGAAQARTSSSSRSPTRSWPRSTRSSRSWTA